MSQYASGYSMQFAQLDMVVSTIAAIVSLPKFKKYKFDFDCLNEIYYINQIEKLGEVDQKRLDSMR
jgi:hypothetical protein